jgi:hypothetical protein
VVELTKPHDSFRAAGQVVAAIAAGLAIESVSTRGIVLKSPVGPARQPRRGEAIAEIAIGLAGIAAIHRYGFGAPPPGEPGRHSACVRWSFNTQQLADFAIVRDLIDTIDPDDEEDILLRAWEQALSFMHDKATWEAVEFFVSLLDVSELEGADIDYGGAEIVRKPQNLNFQTQEALDFRGRLERTTRTKSLSAERDQMTASKYRVLVDDNFDYMNPEARWTAGQFDTAAEAIAKCKSMVDGDLADLHEPGMTADALYQAYIHFGDDPFVAGPTGAETVAFSAWDYAKERCAAICDSAARKR